MEELQVNMLGIPHSNGLAAALLDVQNGLSLCSMLVSGSKRGVWWVLPTVGAPLCTLQTPNTEQQQSHWWRGVAATSGAASLPPASIPPSGVRPAQANNQLGWTVTVWLPSWGERVKKSGIRDKQKVLD